MRTLQFILNALQRARHRQLLAVPFSIDKRKAGAAFDTWAAGHTGIALETVRAEFLPFYVFEGELRGTFTGVLTFRGEEQDVQGVFKRTGLEIEERQMGFGEARTMGVHAGFQYPGARCRVPALSPVPRPFAQRGTSRRPC